MKIYAHRCIFLEPEMFQTKVVEKIKTYILCSITPPPPRKLFRLSDNVEKSGRIRQATDDSIMRHMRLACWISKAANMHSEYVVIIACPWQQGLNGSASTLR
jgi:hypothetical protein